MNSFTSSNPSGTETQVETLRILLDTRDGLVASDYAGAIVQRISRPLNSLTLNPYWKVKAHYELNLTYLTCNLSETIRSLFPQHWLLFDDGSMVNSYPTNESLTFVEWISYQRFDARDKTDGF
jgi:hypothetical protein